MSQNKPIMSCWMQLADFSILSVLTVIVHFHIWPSALDNPFKVYFESSFRLNESIKS